MADNQRSHSGVPMGLRIGAPVIVGVVLLCLWQLITMTTDIPASLLPSPGAVFTRLIRDVGQGILISRTATTISEALLGCVLAIIIALPLGYLIAHFRGVEAALSPYLAASQAVPAIALAPLLVIWVGYGLTPIVLLCALLVFFPLVLATVLGVRTIDPEVVEAAELDGASGWRMITQIELPLSRAALLSGIRNGFTLSITGAVVGEFVMGGEGLGMVLSVESASADTTGLFATLMVLCLLAVVIYGSLLAIEHLTDPYRVPRGTRISYDTDHELPVAHPVLVTE